MALMIRLVLSVLGSVAWAQAETSFACGQISATRVFEVQWSEDQARTDQACSDFKAPYNMDVDVHNDYFEFVEKEGGGLALQQYDEQGTLKAELLGGEVKLANADVVFYIIDGWYGTIITRSSYNYGDAATFTGLTRDPALPCNVSAGACADTDDKAEDSYLDNCAAYSEQPQWCSTPTNLTYYDDDDFTSSDMCCACGGGGGSQGTAATAKRQLRLHSLVGGEKYLGKPLGEAFRRPLRKSASWSLASVALAAAAAASTLAALGLLAWRRHLAKGRPEDIEPMIRAQDTQE